jgi:hypothetical protein
VRRGARVADDPVICKAAGQAHAHVGGALVVVHTMVVGPCGQIHAGGDGDQHQGQAQALWERAGDAPRAGQQLRVARGAHALLQHRASGGGVAVV